MSLSSHVAGVIQQFCSFARCHCLLFSLLAVQSFCLYKLKPDNYFRYIWGGCRDGKLEIVVPTFVHYLEVLDGADGEKLSGWWALETFIQVLVGDVDAFISWLEYKI